MKNFKKSYTNAKWYEFANRVKERDSCVCIKCLRNQSEVILQVHHKIYISKLEPWEYALSDCITLCKGCHAREHAIIEPNKGWILISVIDLGAPDGICERKGCGTEIRYEHEVYHPAWGYKIVGSSCIDFLTKEDKGISTKVLKIYNNISDFVHRSIWQSGYSKKGIEFSGTMYKHHEIRIYGERDKYAFQVAIKEKGVNRRDWGKPIPAKDKSLNEVKELAYIVARGLSTSKESEKSMLRNIYKKLI